MSDTRIDTNTLRVLIKQMSLKSEERDYLERIALDIDRIIVERDAARLSLSTFEAAARRTG